MHRGHPNQPQITTNIVGFSKREWEDIHLAAGAILRSGGDSATIILPGRPELYRLKRTREGFLLRLSSKEEVVDSLTEECDCHRREAGK